MEINRKYLQKYLHDIAIEQLKDEYSSNGYSVSIEEAIGKYQTDLVARKGDENIVIEVKANKLTAKRKKELMHLANYLQKLGNYKFLVVIASPPKEKNIVIDDIEPLLFNEMQEDFPAELIDLSSHTSLDEISDVVIDEISINHSEIYVKGNGTISVELQFGSSGDQKRGDGFVTSDSFPFEFELNLEYNSVGELIISEVINISVDISSYDD